MRRFLIPVLSSIIVLSTILISCSKFPSTHPTLQVISKQDDLSFETSTNGGTWFDSEGKKGGNSFDLGTFNLTRLSEIYAQIVSCNTELNLNLSFTKDIQEFKVYLIQGESILDEKLVEVESSNYKITTPVDNGTYGYIVDTKWDDTHSVRFIFKISCE